MSIKDEIKFYIESSGHTMKEVAESLSKSSSEYSYQNLYNKLSKETIRYKEVKRIAEIIGYEIKWTTETTSGDLIIFDENRERHIIIESKHVNNSIKSQIPPLDIIHEPNVDYYEKDAEQIFLHGIKRLAQTENVSMDTLFLDALDYLHFKYIFKSQANTHNKKPPESK